jgi:hypothetical protein
VGRQRASSITLSSVWAVPDFRFPHYRSREIRILDVNTGAGSDKVFTPTIFITEQFICLQLKPEPKVELPFASRSHLGHAGTRFVRLNSAQSDWRALYSTRPVAARFSLAHNYRHGRNADTARQTFCDNEAGQVCPLAKVLPPAG